MDWEPLIAGKYERPCDQCETWMKLVCDSAAEFNREHWIVSVIARFRVDDSTDAEVLELIRKAWIHLRHQQPAIAVVVKGDKLSYQVPETPQLNDWAAETVVREDRTVEEFFSTKKSTALNTVHYFPKTSQVMIRSHHWLIDGMGAVALMNLLFSNMAQNDPRPLFGNEWERLPPSITVAGDLADSSSDKAVQDGETMWAEYLGNLPSVGLPYEDQEIGGTCRSRVNKPDGFGEALKTACKSKAISVSSAVHAAIACATYKMAKPSLKDNNYTPFALFDYRQYLKSPYDNVEQRPAGYAMLFLPFSIPKADFITNAQAIQKVYGQPISDREYHKVRGWNHYLLKMSQVLAAGSASGEPLPSQPQLSNLGVLDQHLKHTYGGAKSINVDDIEVVTDQMTPTIVLTQWSFQDVFHLSAKYNENLYQSGFVDRFLAEVMSILCTELNLGM